MNDAETRVLYAALAEVIALREQVTRLQAGQSEQLKMARAEAWHAAAQHCGSMACWSNPEENPREALMHASDVLEDHAKACLR